MKIEIKCRFTGKVISVQRKQAGHLGDIAVACICIPLGIIALVLL